MIKRITLILSLLALSVTGLWAGDSLNVLDAQGRRQGPWVIKGNMQKNAAYGPESKVEEGRYKDNLKVGVWISYFPSGKKQSEFTWVNGRPNGPAKNYFENGQVEESGTWIGQRWSGDYHRYYDNGVERQHFNYNTSGVRNGAQTYTNPNGTKQIEVTIVNGKEDGWKREYDANGKLIRETFYNGGVIDNSKTKEYATTTATATAPEDPSKDKTPPPPPPKIETPPANWNGEGPYTLMRGGQVSQKGTFHLYKLVDGEVRVYDNNGLWVGTKIYKGGKYVGDGVVPADANK